MGIFRTIKSALAGAALGFRATWGNYSDAVGLGSTDRSSNYLVWLDADTRQYLDPWTREIVYRKVEWLFQNFGVVKEAVRGIARLTVGRGIGLQLNTDDEEWNALAEEQFEAWACAPSRCDMAGRRSFYQLQKFAVTQRIKAGEFWAAFFGNPRWDGEPALQVYDAKEVVTPPENGTDLYVVDGVRLDRNHCPISYFVQGLNDQCNEIPASEMVHWYFADAANQVRGISDLAQAVAPLADAYELGKIVTKTAKQNSAIGLHVKKLVKNGGQGAFDKIRTIQQRQKVGQGLAPGGQTYGQSNDVDPSYERLAGGGAIIYTDEGGDVKFLTPNSPSPLVEPFITKVLMRNGLSSLGAPAELFWDCANLNSANQRYVLAKGDALFTELADDLEAHLCNPAAVRFLISRMETGKLRRPLKKVLTPAAPDPAEAEAEKLAPGFIGNSDKLVESWVEDTGGDWMNKLSWQRPARLTIDNSRDAAAEINQLSNGIETLSTINDRRGRSWRQVTSQWFREFAFAARCARQNGVPWAINLWRAGLPGQKASQPVEDPDEAPNNDPAPAPAQRETGNDDN